MHQKYFEKKMNHGENRWHCNSLSIFSRIPLPSASLKEVRHEKLKNAKGSVTARSLEIGPRGRPPLYIGGPPLEFINIQPPKMHCK